MDNYDINLEILTILRMSYQAGIRIPPFRVTGIDGAVGQITFE